MNWGGRNGFPALGVLGVLALALGGCGGGGDNGRYDAQDVTRVFSRADVELVNHPSSVYDALSLPSGTNVSGRDSLGAFNIYVTKNDRSRDLFKHDTSQGKKGPEIKPAAGGIYWQPPSGESDTWTARKFYDNVVLEWIGGKERRTDERWNELNAILANLARPADKYKLPPRDRPCKDSGINPDGPGRAGTCKLGDQTLVIVNPGTPLKLPNVRLTGVRVERRRQIVSHQFGLVRRLKPRGEFVIARYRIFNSSKGPISSFRPGLAIAGKRYESDTRNEFYVQPEQDPYPIQPDEGASLVSLFDVPPPAAAELTRKGALEVSGDPEFSTLDYAKEVGRVRLAGGAPTHERSF